MLIADGLNPAHKSITKNSYQDVTKVFFQNKIHDTYPIKMPHKHGDYMSKLIIQKVGRVYEGKVTSRFLSRMT